MRVSRPSGIRRSRSFFFISIAVDGVSDAFWHPFQSPEQNAHNNNNIKLFSFSSLRVVVVLVCPAVKIIIATHNNIIITRNGIDDNRRAYYYARAPTPSYRHKNTIVIVV